MPVRKLSPPWDCLVVGGGPAGLTAATYLARFHLSVLVVDSGKSRAASIPLTRNHAGFPGGIAGSELLARMRAQAGLYSARYQAGFVSSLKQEEDLWRAEVSDGSVQARTVLLATGVFNRRPAMPERLHDEAVARALLRYCPVCDGYEVTDQTVGVIGTGLHGVQEAEFLRSYTADVTLITPEGSHPLDPAQTSRLNTARIKTLRGPCLRFELKADEITVTLPGGTHAFASIYPALGSDVRSELATSIGAEATNDGCLLVDEHQRTSLPGLYAAGDVVIGLDQISHAMGQAGVAASAIRKDLSNRRALYR